MDLNNITTQVRPRNKWQALDLGFKMASQWYAELFKGYLAVSLPLFIVLNLVFFESPLIAFVIFWWLKPISERIQLSFLSHAMFGQQLNLKQQMALWMQTPKSDWLSALTIGRISLRRSYYGPIRQLENQKGKHFTKRKVAFRGDNDKAAFWLTIVLVHLESVIVMALLALANYLLPAQTGISFDVFGLEETTSYSTIYHNALIYFSYLLIAPFFTCGGFSLYINQRTQTEGWDIEISFRRLITRTQTGNKYSAGPSSTAAKSILLAMLIGCLSSFSEPTYSADSENAGESPAQQTVTIKTDQQQKAHDQIQTIIQSDTFNQKVTRSYPEAFLDFKTGNDSDSEMTQVDLPQWLHSTLKTLSTSIEWLLTLIVLSLLVLFVVRYRHWFAQFLPESAQQAKGPQYKQLFGLELPQSDSIKDVQQQAQQLLQAKQKREALGLLYRASLQILVHQEHIKVNDAFTEGECVKQVKQNASKAISHYFKTLTQNWQRLAYANKEPDNATLTTLIEQWSQVFVPAKDSKDTDASKDARKKAQGGKS